MLEVIYVTAVMDWVEAGNEESVGNNLIAGL